MDDSKIIELFFARSEQAISELSAKYGKLIFSISHNILKNKEDASECENDTYLSVWDVIPPQNPNPLCAFVCRIARNLSLKNTGITMPEKETAVLTWRWKSWTGVFLTGRGGGCRSLQQRRNGRQRSWAERLMHLSERWRKRSGFFLYGDTGFVIPSVRLLHGFI